MLALELLRVPKVFVTLQSPYETLEPNSARARFRAASARRRLAGVSSPSVHGTNLQIRCGISENLAVTVRHSIDTERVAGGDGRHARRLLELDDAAQATAQDFSVETMVESCRSLYRRSSAAPAPLRG
jgi:hypothetical protein